MSLPIIGHIHSSTNNLCTFSNFTDKRPNSHICAYIRASNKFISPPVKTTWAKTEKIARVFYCATTTLKRLKNLVAPRGIEPSDNRL